VGCRRAGARIKQGSPLEEASLVSHVHSLAPRPGILEEVGQLAELLVLMGHDADARTLQRAISGWQGAYAVSGQEGRNGLRSQLVTMLCPCGTWL
jgi:hypothetical protein